MNRYYLDASAVVKRYASETGSSWVRALADPQAGHSILLSELTLAEVAAALAAKQRAPNGITLQERDSALALFLGQCSTQYHLVAPTRTAIDRAVGLTQNHRLRGYDALQLAVALTANDALKAAQAGELIFVCADDDLLTAAQAEGIVVDNPNSHP